MRVKHWAAFQHYKNRRPPWIKLHRELLDNYEFHSLPDSSQAILPMLWLLASESDDGSIPEAQEIAFRLRKTVQVIDLALKPLIDKGFLLASNALAVRKQDATLEVERETEEEKEGERPLATLATPENLHPMQYAAHICDELAIPKNGNMQTVADSVEVLAKSRKTDAREAHDYLLAKALAAKEAGTTVNLFWFRDGKYNISRQSNDSHKTAAQLRNERASSAIDRAFGAEEATGDMPEAFRQRAGRI